jgi:hypothetical protein
MHGSSRPSFPHPKSSAVISVLPAEVLEGINKVIDEKDVLNVHFQQNVFSNLSRFIECDRCLE